MDFSRIIRQLLDDGWTQAKIARTVNASQGHLSQIKNKKTGIRGPSYELGVALLMLARRDPPDDTA